MKKHTETRQEEAAGCHDKAPAMDPALVLDTQLQDTTYQFEHKQGVAQKIGSRLRPGAAPHLPELFAYQIAAP